MHLLLAETWETPYKCAVVANSDKGDEMDVVENLRGNLRDA
jgi:hypothetical protein